MKCFMDCQMQGWLGMTLYAAGVIGLGIAILAGEWVYWTPRDAPGQWGKVRGKWPPPDNDPETEPTHHRRSWWRCKLNITLRGKV